MRRITSGRSHWMGWIAGVYWNWPHWHMSSSVRVHWMSGRPRREPSIVLHRYLLRIAHGSIIILRNRWIGNWIVYWRSNVVMSTLAVCLTCASVGCCPPQTRSGITQFRSVIVGEIVQVSRSNSAVCLLVMPLSTLDPEGILVGLPVVDNSL